MYEPQYQCWTCGVPMRYDGQCLKCKEPKAEADTFRCKPHTYRISNNDLDRSNEITMGGHHGCTVTLRFLDRKSSEGFCKPGAEYDVTITPVGKDRVPTTTEKAISALNARNHRGSSTWCRCNNDGDIHDGIPRHFLDPTTGFLWHNEAIAIAEWYERNPESK